MFLELNMQIHEKDLEPHFAHYRSPLKLVKMLIVFSSNK